MNQLFTYFSPNREIFLPYNDAINIIKNIIKIPLSDVN